MDFRGTACIGDDQFPPSQRESKGIFWDRHTHFVCNVGRGALDGICLGKIALRGVGKMGLVRE